MIHKTALCALRSQAQAALLDRGQSSSELIFLSVPKLVIQRINDAASGWEGQI